MSAELILSLDQGTTSSRALVTDAEGRQLGLAQMELPAEFPRSGWIEQDPEQIWAGQLAAASQALELSGFSATDLAAIGITNQRETTLLWNRRTGMPIGNAIVWQDRRSADIIAGIVKDGHTRRIRELTGLQPDAYFSAGKLRWRLDQQPELRKQAENGELAFGTVDSWLLYRLTGGSVHATDVTNASRTMLFDTERLQWSQELLEIFGIPAAILPEVKPSIADFGMAAAGFLGAEVPIMAIAGDQHAAAFGQACFQPGMSKNTYGTGCFMVQYTGGDRRVPEGGLLGTMAWQLSDGQAEYAVEGSVFTAGAAIQWLRDGLKIIDQAADVTALAESVPDNGDVYLVPAFTGLAAPYWDAQARGTLTGISRGTSAGHVARAVLEGIALQVTDVFRVFESESGYALPELRVDGGAAQSDLLLQLQADALAVPVVRTARMESTAFGAAFMAGLGAGIWADTSDIADLWRSERVFEPRMNADDREHWLSRWADAVGRSRNWAR